MKFKESNPYEYSKFHQDLLDFIHKYYPNNALIDNYKLFNLYADILTNYSNGMYDKYNTSKWQDEIINFYNKENKKKK